MVDGIGSRIAGLERCCYAGAPGAFAIAGVEEDGVGWGGEDVAGCVVYCRHGEDVRPSA